MAYISKLGYVERKTHSNKSTNAKPTSRNWWIPKYNGMGTSGVHIGYINTSKKYVGKKVRFRIEELNETPFLRQGIVLSILSVNRLLLYLENEKKIIEAELGYDMSDVVKFLIPIINKNPKCSDTWEFEKFKLPKGKPRIIYKPSKFLPLEQDLELCFSKRGIKVDNIAVTNSARTYTITVKRD